MLTDSQHFFFRMDVLSIQKKVFFTVASFKHRLPAVFETLLSPDDFIKSSNVFYFALFSCFMDSSVFDILRICLKHIVHSWTLHNYIQICFIYKRYEKFYLFLCIELSLTYIQYKNSVHRGRLSIPCVVFT